MKQIFIFSVLLISVFSFENTNAQNAVISGYASYNNFSNPQSVVGKAFYDFTYLKDTTQPDNLYKEVYELDYGKSAALFSSYSKKVQDSSMAADISSQIKMAPDPNHVDLVIHGSGDISDDEFFTDISSSPKIYDLKSIDIQPFEIADTQPKIDWKILDSTKIIQGNLCQKAIGESHGRTYTAWFCADLPYGFGPRKLNGLPGLILEVYDEKREVVYTLNHLQNNVAGEQIGLSKDDITTTQEQYDKAREAYKKNPQAFIDAHPQSNAHPAHNLLDGIIDASKIQSITVKKTSGAPNSKPIKKNNPIDLK